MATVSMVKCERYDARLIQQQLEYAVDLIGGWKKFVSRGQKVLLKSNLIAPRKPDEAATTHPEVLRALVRCLKARGCEVSIGDSAGGAIAGVAPTAQALVVAGYADVCKEEGANLVNFDRMGTVPVKNSAGGAIDVFHIARPVIESDVVINVPKLKVHSMGGYTGAVKNTFGCIPGLRKAEYHRMAPDIASFGEIIAGIHLACRVTLNVMDGIVGMEGAGPTNGTPKHAGILLLSADSLALDTIASSAIGLDPGAVETLSAAARLSVGESNQSAINLVGDFESVPKLGFALPVSVRSGGGRMPRWVLPLVINMLRTRPSISRSACRKCGVCRESCPVKAIDDSINIDYSACIQCLCCQELCPHGAVKLERANPVSRLLIPAGKTFRGH